MALKGITKIQFFDAETGELTDEIVKENMITNAVPNILNPSNQMHLGATSNSLGGFLNVLTPLGKTLFGGILIFSEPLEENVDNIIPSVQARNSIVGYAGQYAGNTDNDFRGTYNTTESVELANGFTHVWDFSTEQANGEIAAVALTSAMGGDCGWNTQYNINDRGNFFIPIIPSSDLLAEDKSPIDGDLKFSNSTCTTLHMNELCPIPGILTNGKYVAYIKAVNNSGTITLDYYVKPIFTDINLVQKITGTTDFSDTEKGKISEGTWSGVATDLGISSIDTYKAQTRGNTYSLVVFSSNSIRQSNTVQVAIKDFVLNDDGTVTEKDPIVFSLVGSDILTVFQAKDSSITKFESCFYYDRLIRDGYFYFQTADYFVRVNISNTSDIEIFDKPADLVGSYVSIGELQGEIILSNYKSEYNGTAYNKMYRTSDFINYYRLDDSLLARGTITEFNMSAIKPPYTELAFIERGNQYNNNVSFSVKPILLAPYLATINNLDSVVTKTSSKSMKITYTIQNV